MRRRLSFVAVVGLLTSLLTVGAAGLSASSASSDSPTRIASKSAAARADHQSGRASGSQLLDFEVILQLQHPAEANATVQAVADPASPSYHHYLSSADFLARFAPSEAAVTAVRAWMHKQGIQTDAASADRLSVPAHATVAQIERAFNIHLNTYKYGDKTARLADQDLALPSSLASLVTGAVGIDDFSAFTRPALVSDSQSPARLPAAGSPFPQPPGFKNAPPCSQPWGQKIDTTDPALAGFANPLPYVPCGLTPPRLRSAYGVDAAVSNGNDGGGVTVAITDAYASPTLFADARKYSQLHDPAHVLQAGQFSEMLASKFNQGAACSASGWYGEQTLDVEMVHGLAPGAHILYMGAENCNNGLYDTLHRIILGHLAQIVTNSWGTAGEIVPAGIAKVFVELTQDAALQGIGMYFSSGDNADEIANLGVAQPDFEPSTPFVTAVGGTALATASGGSRLFEVGWEDGKSSLVNGAWVPGGAGAFLYGAGGGTSSLYAQPAYQKGVVPAALANARTDVVGAPMPARVVPDVAAVGSPTTGVLVGETQAFADSLTGTSVDNRYGEFRLGGTSVSSPVFAGIMALADQRAGFAHGFANFALYRAGKAFAASGPFHDIVPAATPLAVIRTNYVDAITFNPAAGFSVSARTLQFGGTETFCTNPADPTTCQSLPITLHTTLGYDNVTGLGTPNGIAFLNALR